MGNGRQKLAHRDLSADVFSFNWNPDDSQLPIVFFIEPILGNRDSKARFVCSSLDGTFSADFEDGTFHPDSIHSHCRQIGIYSVPKRSPETKSGLNELFRNSAAVVRYPEHVLGEFKAGLITIVWSLIIWVVTFHSQRAVHAIIE